MYVYSPKVYECGPLAMRNLIAAIPESRWDERLDPSRFSPREVLAHLADWEEIWMERFNAGLKSPGATIQGYDEGQFAIDRNYAARNPVSEADRFIEGRKELAKLMRGLGEQELEIKVIHTERGEMTLGDLVELAIGHDLYHIEQLSNYL
jgi:uncharacterized damage-inducible protein DinB